MAEAAETTDTTEETSTKERDASGRFQPKVKKARSLLPFEDRMAAKAAEQAAAGAAKLPDDEEPAESEAEETEGDTPAATASSPTGKEPPAPKPRRETVDTEKPDFTKERLEFSEWKRKQREGLEAHLRTERQKHEAELKTERETFEKQRTEHTPRMEKAERVLKLMETADYEALAKEAGYEDWEKFQGHVLGTITDPNYKETRAIRRELEETKAKAKAEKDAADARAKQEAEENARRGEAQQRAAAVKAHKEGLAAAMAKSPDRVVATLADDPQFVEIIFAIQGQNYDPQTNSTVTPEQAIKMALRGAPRTLLEQITLQRDRLNKALAEAAEAAGAPAAATPAPGATGKPKAPKTAVVPASATIEAAPNGKFKGPKDPAWRAYRDKMMQEAFDEEEAAKQAKRAAKGAR